MKKFSIILLSVCIFAVAVPGVSAQQSEEKGYVSDMLLLTVRKGPGKNYNVTRTIRSDTPVYILEKKDRYARVRLEDGTTGWVESQYITFEPPESQRISKLESRIEDLQDRVGKLSKENEPLEQKVAGLKEKYENELKNLEAEFEAVKEEKGKAESKLARLEKKYNDLVEKSDNVTKVFQENKRLKEKTEVLSGKLAKLEKQNKDLLKTGIIKWFLAGAGVLFLGWLVGKSISKSKRRSSKSLLG